MSSSGAYMLMRQAGVCDGRVITKRTNVEDAGPVGLDEHLVVPVEHVEVTPGTAGQHVRGESARVEGKLICAH